MPVNFLHYLVWRCTTAAAKETGHIETRGAKIRYLVYGEGKPVLLLHGGLSNKLSWFSQIPTLVNAGRQVVLIDTRGHGESTPGHAELKYETFAHDALQVLDRLGIQRTDIVGWSDGGIIALLLGLEAPQRVDRIVAISANFHPSGLLIEQQGQATRLDNRVWRNPLFEALRSWWSGAYERHAGLQAQLNRIWRSEPRLSRDDLKAIGAPTLVIAGENDIIDLPHSGELAQSLANGRLEIILGAGHAAPVTHADQVNALIAGFLQL
ncbi:alpha/beta hydrolase [Methylomonas sp.]|uniref:alpha/beta fold hydrolase n=1 Tax=Methylomonas sp. TaxID=418 RepID=UPI0025FCDDBA|nr:alpha/beta hydrolase [Methylomonas sp.]